MSELIETIEIEKEKTKKTEKNVITKSHYFKNMAKNVAIEYYRRHAASAGRCAQIAGMSKEDFITYLGENELSIFQFENDAEFLKDIENA